VWIDYNRNGIFENSEWKQLSLTSATGTVINNNISVPANAQAGITGMRIRTRTSNSTNDSTSACANFASVGQSLRHSPTGNKTIVHRVSGQDLYSVILRKLLCL
jgi:hypothetical protein